MKYSKIISALGLCAVAATVYADEGPVIDSVKDNAQEAATVRAVHAYWTKSAMQTAKAREATVIVSAAELNAPVSGQEEISGPAGVVAGCLPGAVNCNPTPRTLSTANAESGSTAAPMHGSAPTNPKNGPYGPFQRWREATPITSYPKSTVGKLFFTLNGGNYVCSASVIGRSTVLTAGHCVSDGQGHWATNLLFCPSYDGTLADPRQRGCWTVVFKTTSSPWHNTSNPDYDYACLVTATTGTKYANKVGNVTGTLGRAWNFASSQAERTFGYPAAAPFNGGTLQTTASTDWYSWNFNTSDAGQVSKIIGSDLTGGSSGGPWILGWTGGLTETGDTDASNATDPGNNWTNGVNSHKRCLVNCNTPPTTTSGVFWQEMTSPPFRGGSTADLNESEDVFAICLRHTNNNP